MESLTELHSNGRLLALPIGIRVGWNLITVANTPAYNDMTTITALKYVIIQNPVQLH
jgi:hypothetical protein